MFKKEKPEMSNFEKFNDMTSTDKLKPSKEWLDFDLMEEHGNYDYDLFTQKKREIHKKDDFDFLEGFGQYL